MADIFDKLTAQNSSSEAELPEPDLTAPELSEPSLGADSSTSTAADDQTPQQYTGRKIKEAVQEVLKYGLLEATKKPNLYQVLLTHQPTVAEILEPLDLTLRIDDIRGLAFVRVAEQSFESDVTDADEWSHPLVRRQRLNLEQSLLVALLRQHFVAHELEAGIGASNAVVALEDLLPQIQLYLGDLGSDAREQTRLRNLLDKLKGHGIVSEIDKHDQVIIRPIIAHVANPENLINLLQVFRQQAEAL